MADIEDLLAREALAAHPSEDSLERTLERVARRRRRRRVSAAVVGLSVAAAGLGVGIAALAGTHHPTTVPGSSVSATPSEPGDQGNLVFEEVSVGAAPADLPGTVVVHSRIEWTGDTFPGIHRCTWSAFGPDGSEVGSTTTQVLELAPGYENKQEVQVSGPADSATVSCDPERLDIGQPYAYEFTDIRMEPAAYVTFTERWLGKGVPGAMACTLTVQDQTRRILTEQNFTFRGSSDPMTEQTWIGPLSGPETGDVSAQIKCEPYERPLPTPSRSPVETGGSQGHFTIAVLNATDRPGLAGVTADGLARDGYVVVWVGLVLGDHTAVYFATEDHRREAEQLAAAYFSGVPVDPLPDSISQYAKGADVVVVLGPDSAS